MGSYQLAITIGLLLAAIINNATHKRQDTGSYRIPIAVQFAWSLILIIGMFILPETPRYLIKVGKLDAAIRSLSKLRRLPVDHEAIKQEIDEIQANHEYELSLGKAGYIDCFKGSIGKRQLTGCLLQGLQQLTGINFIFYYGTQYFKNSGINNAFVISMITSGVNTASTIPGLWAIDKWGRRPLLFWGGKSSYGVYTSFKLLIGIYVFGFAGYNFASYSIEELYPEFSENNSLFLLRINLVSCELRGAEGIIYNPLI